MKINLTVIFVIVVIIVGGVLFWYSYEPVGEPEFLSIKKDYEIEELKNDIVILPVEPARSRDLRGCFYADGWERYIDEDYDFSMSIHAGFSRDPFVTDFVDEFRGASISLLCYKDGGESIVEGCEEKDKLRGLKREYMFFGTNDTGEICEGLPYNFSFTVKIYENTLMLPIIEWVSSNFPPFLICGKTFLNGLDGLQCMSDNSFTSKSVHSVFRSFFITNKNFIYHFEPYDVNPLLQGVRMDPVEASWIYEAMISTVNSLEDE